MLAGFLFALKSLFIHSCVPVQVKEYKENLENRGGEEMLKNTESHGIEEKLLKPGEAAAALRVTTWTLRDWARETPPLINVEYTARGHMRIPQSEIDRLRRRSRKSTFEEDIPVPAELYGGFDEDEDEEPEQVTCENLHHYLSAYKREDDHL